MRLSEYPMSIVRIACSKCSRRGAYRLARLANRYGAECTIPALLAQLAGDCKHRDVRFGSADYCGAFFPDLGARPPDEPITARPAPKVVR